MIKTLNSNAGVQVRSLVGELRSHMLLTWSKNKKKKKIPKSFTVFPDMKEGQRQRTTSHSQNNREACVATPLGKLQSRRGASGSLAQARSAPGGEITEAGSFLLDWGIPRRASAASEPVQAWPHG